MTFDTHVWIFHFSRTAKHNWRKDAALELPALFRKSSGDERQIFFPWNATMGRVVVVAVVCASAVVRGVSCFHQVSLERSVRTRWPPFCQQTHDRHVALSGNLKRAIATKQGSFHKDAERPRGPAKQTLAGPPKTETGGGEGRRT